MSAPPARASTARFPRQDTDNRSRWFDDTPAHLHNIGAPYTQTPKDRTRVLKFRLRVLSLDGEDRTARAEHSHGQWHQ
ncbi:MAG TPA: hypothetical protein VGD68_12670, partial [Streptosporangiaceae bacterium]